jgi:hypothetical protein
MVRILLLTGIKYILINLKKEKMGLSTLDIQLPGSGSGNGNSGAYKGINPGNYKAKINKVELWDRPWKPEENALFLVLNLETTKPSEDFEGYPIDDQNPDGPKHEGLVGNVRTSTYAFKDGMNTRTGKPVSRDREILTALLGLCTEMRIEDWFRGANGKYDTIGEWIAAFNEEKPYEGKYLEFCIAAEEYLAKDGKVKKILYLPKAEKINEVWNLPYKSLTSDKKLLQYNEGLHFKKVVAKPVEEFKAEDVDVDVDIKPFDVDIDDVDGFDM